MTSGPLPLVALTTLCALMAGVQTQLCVVCNSNTGVLQERPSLFPLAGELAVAISLTAWELQGQLMQ